MSAEHFSFRKSTSGSIYICSAILRVPSGAVCGRHDPSIVDERSPAEDEYGTGRGLRGQSHLPRDLALVRVLAAHHAGVPQGRATANLGGSFLVQDYPTSSTQIIDQGA